jgi:hypothetical protein
MSNPLRNLFSNTIKIKDVDNTDYENLMFILVNEFHWTQKDIQETDLPFVYELLYARKRMIDEQEKDLKRRR